MAHFLLAQVLSPLGAKDAAAEHLRTALSLDPELARRIPGK
jgi:Tfp pilus assembly protein PilF